MSEVSSQRTGARGRELHLLPVADFLSGYAVDRRSDAVKDGDRALLVRQDRLIFLVELYAGFKAEIFARLAWAFDLALAVFSVDCEDDEAAKERAKLLVDGHDVKLWDGARKIAELGLRAEPLEDREIGTLLNNSTGPVCWSVFC